jgi:hypothetical protein
MSKRICIFGLILFGMAALGAAQPTSFPWFFPQVQTSGMVGLTVGQTARLNVLNPGMPGPAVAVDAVCSAQLSFLNDQGVVLKTATVNVAPGKSVPIDLDRDTDLASVTDKRVELRAVIQIPPVTPVVPVLPQPITCALVPTLEVFNNDTGKTELIMAQFNGVFLPGPVVPVPGPVTVPVNP